MEASNFFSRLLRPSKPAVAVIEPDDPGAFDQAWRTVQETLEHPDERQLVKGIFATEVPRCLTHIVDALVYESNRIDEETLGACMEYFVKHDLLANLERLCESDRPHGIKSEVLKAINNLVVLLSDQFLVHNSVHRPLRRLLRSCIGDKTTEQGSGDKLHGTVRAVGAAAATSDVGVDAELEGDLVDLMCTLCSRMRAYPPLLLIFFHDKGWLHPNITSPPAAVASDTASSRRSGSVVQPHFEFLLFSYLLRFVHREGRIGDFARAGLLFLFDIAFLPAEDTATAVAADDPLLVARHALVEYITDGDFADVMAAGLGALWSLLPSKLRVPTLSDVLGGGEEEQDGTSAPASGGMVLGTAPRTSQKDGGHDDDDATRSSRDNEVRDQLDMLLKLLGFVQDIMIRCQPATTSPTASDGSVSPTGEMGRSIIEHTLDSVKTSFLDSVLYPSILECSSRDGSAMAIMTYLDVMLSNLDDGRVMSRFLTYLLGVNDRDEPEAESSERYTLRDLLISNLQSNPSSPASATAALNLYRTLLVEHCRISTHGLLQTISEPIPLDRPPAHGRPSEVPIYAELLSRLDRSLDDLEQSPTYAHYLADMHSAIQDDRCYQLSLLAPHEHGDGVHWDRQFGMRLHRLSPSDPLLRSLLQGLGRFLYATPDENVALTGVIIALATCPHRSLKGWLLYDPSERDPWPSTDAKQHNDIFTTLSQAQDDQPAIYQILLHLSQQIASFRSYHPQFDTLRVERRQGLLFTDHLDEAMNVMLDVEPSTSTSVFGSPTPKKQRAGVMGTLASFLTPTRSKPSPTPSSSPAPLPPSTPPPAFRSTSVRNTKTESPFKSHYDGVRDQQVEATHSPISAGAWSPAHAPAIDPDRSVSSSTRPTSSLSRERSDDPSLQPQRATAEDRIVQVSLSTVLDNCIILEEFIKELVGLLSARRALGIDEVDFGDV